MQVNLWQQEQHWMKVLAIRYELLMLGAPIDGPMWLFGDNKSMIDSASEPLEAPSTVVLAPVVRKGSNGYCVLCSCQVSRKIG
jgi:hypothetical protein